MNNEQMYRVWTRIYYYSAWEMSTSLEFPSVFEYPIGVATEFVRGMKTSQHAVGHTADVWLQPVDS